MKCECGGDMKHHDKAVRIVRENLYLAERKRSKTV